MRRLTLAQLNALPAAEWLALLGGIFEHSAWVAERSIAARPFLSLAQLHQHMLDTVTAASRDEQLALLRAHPELAGREAVDGGLTADSSTEQGRLGFTALSTDEFRHMAALNKRYRETFGFPAIVALALHADRHSVMREIEQRSGNTRDEEISNGLAQVGHIALARLQKLIII